MNGLNYYTQTPFLYDHNIVTWTAVVSRQRVKCCSILESVELQAVVQAHASWSICDWQFIWLRHGLLILIPNAHRWPVCPGIVLLLLLLCWNTYRTHTHTHLHTQPSGRCIRCLLMPRSDSMIMLDTEGIWEFMVGSDISNKLVAFHHLLQVITCHEVYMCFFFMWRCRKLLMPH